jgi:hypothetical protein
VLSAGCFPTKALFTAKHKDGQSQIGRTILIQFFVVNSNIWVPVRLERPSFLDKGNLPQIPADNFRLKGGVDIRTPSQNMTRKYLSQRLCLQCL